jgi:hypothetical protein
MLGGGWEGEEAVWDGGRGRDEGTKAWRHGDSETRSHADTEVRGHGGTEEERKTKSGKPKTKSGGEFETPNIEARTLNAGGGREVGGDAFHARVLSCLNFLTF